MPTYVGLEQQGFYEPFKILAQGLQARADRKLRQQQIDLENKASGRAERQTSMQESEFGLKKPLMQEEGRQASNKKALDAAISESQPNDFFSNRSPQDQSSFYNTLAKHGYNGDLGAALATHDAAASSVRGLTPGPLTQAALTGGQIGRPSPGSQPGPSGPAAPSSDPGNELQVQPPTTQPGTTPLPTPGPAGPVGQVGGLPSVKPPANFDLGYHPRPYMKSGEKGMSVAFTGPDDATSYSSPTPEQIDALRKDPSQLARFSPAVQKIVAPIVEQGQKAEEMLRKRISESSPLVAYNGHGTTVGIRHIDHLMDAATQTAKDPRTGQIDWNKLDPVRSFSLVFSDAQANNPGAIVRPSDVENIEGLQGMGDKAWNYIQSKVHGNHLSPELKKNLYNMVKDKIAGARGLAVSEFDNIAEEAKSYGVPPERLVGKPFLDEYNAFKSGPQQVNPGAQVSAPGNGAPSAEDIRAAFRAGKMTLPEAKAALIKSGHFRQ